MSNELDAFFSEGVAALTELRGRAVTRLKDGSVITAAALDFERGSFVAEDGGIITSADLIMTLAPDYGEIEEGEKFVVDDKMYWTKFCIGDKSSPFFQVILDYYGEAGNAQP